MKKKNNTYRLTLESIKYADGTSEPHQRLETELSNHDELFAIIERAKSKNLFDEPAQAEQFALGLKLFSEVMLKHRTLTLFEEFSPAFGAFMKKLKGK